MNAGTVWLITRRELVSRLRAKSFVWGTLGLLVVIAGYVVFSMFLSDSAPTKIAVGGEAGGLKPSITAAAKNAGEKVEIRELPRVDPGGAAVRAAERQIRDGDLDVLVTGFPDHLKVTVDERLDEGLRAVLRAVAAQQAIQIQLNQAGVDPAQVERSVAAASVDVDSLQPVDPRHSENLVLAAAMMALLYLGLVTYGMAVAQGVVEEKTTRVVELLLATVRPWQLLLGKVLGIGLVGLVQLLILAVSGLIAVRVTGVLTLPAAGIGLLASLLGWYVLGFFLFATLFAAGGSLVSRYEDMQSVVTPLIMTIAGVFVVGLNLLLRDPESKLVEVLSLIPPFTTILLPARAVLGSAPGWQLAVGVAATLLLLAALVWLAGRIYRHAVLHTGSKLSLRQAWRG